LTGIAILGYKQTTTPVTLEIETAAEEQEQPVEELEKQEN
jgi:hypothetical protein